MQAGLLLDEGEGLIIVEAVQLDGLDRLIYVISHELLYRMANIKEKGRQRDDLFSLNDLATLAGQDLTPVNGINSVVFLVC